MESERPTCSQRGVLQYTLPNGRWQQTSHIRAGAVHEVYDVGVLGDIGILLEGEPTFHRRDVDVNVPRDVDLAVLAPARQTPAGTGPKQNTKSGSN